MVQANENDEEVLEQLVQAAETGDVAILRTLLTDPRLRVLGSDGRGGASRRRRRSDGRGASRPCPGGFARRADVDFLGQALTASSAPRSSGATRRDRRARSARISIQSLLLREWRHLKVLG